MRRMIDLEAVHRLLNERMGHVYSRRTVFRWLQRHRVTNYGNNRVARYDRNHVLRCLP